MQVADEPPNAWLLGPPGSLVEFLANEIVVAGLSKRAITLTRASPWLFKAAARGIPKHNKAALVAIQRLMREAASDSAFAEQEADSDFQTISSHSLVAVWAATETAIEQTLLNHIRKLPNISELMLDCSPTLRVERISTDTEVGVRKALRQWESALDEPSAMDRALKMLSALKLNVVVTEDLRHRLTEMSEIRNVLMHRGGIADDWFVAKCPWLELRSGDAIAVTGERLTVYIDAAKSFAVALMRASAESPFAYRPPPSHNAEAFHRATSHAGRACRAGRRHPAGCLAHCTEHPCR